MGVLADQLQDLLPQIIRSAGNGGLTTAAGLRSYEQEVIDVLRTLEDRPTSTATLSIATATELGGVKSAGADLDGNVIVNADGSMTAPPVGVTVEQDLLSNSPTSLPSIAAVRSAVASILPAQDAATTGQVLTSDGSSAYWQAASGGTPQSGIQTAAVSDFGTQFQTRTFTGTLTLNEFLGAALGKEIRLEITSSSSTDTLIIGGQQLNGNTLSEFMTPLKVNGGTSSWTIQDQGGPFVGGVKNILTLQIVGPTTLALVCDPLV